MRQIFFADVLFKSPKYVEDDYEVLSAMLHAAPFIGLSQCVHQLKKEDITNV